MPRSRNFKTNCEDSKLKKLTVTCMSLRTWLKHLNQNCFFAMFFMSKKLKKPLKPASRPFRLKLISSGSLLKSKRWKNTMLRC